MFMILNWRYQKFLQRLGIGGGKQSITTDTGNRGLIKLW